MLRAAERKATGIMQVPGSNVANDEETPQDNEISEKEEDPEDQDQEGDSASV